MEARSGQRSYINVGLGQAGGGSPVQPVAVVANFKRRGRELMDLCLTDSGHVRMLQLATPTYFKA